MVDGKFEGARHGTVGLSTALSLRCPPITLSGLASALLRGRFHAGASHITDCLDSLPDGLALVLEVLEDFMDDIPPERLVKVFLIQLDHLMCEPSRHEAVNRQVKRLARIERSLCPRLGHKEGLFRPRQPVLLRVKFV